MSNKRERQATIRELVAARAVASQEELRRLLRSRGWDVTQSTLSRDLREMRLTRVPTSNGVRYGAPDAPPDEARPALDRLLPALFTQIDGVGELAVVRTQIGSAQSVAAAIDAAGWADVVGTIAGDDTILVICRSGSARDRVTRRIQALAAAQPPAG